ncbi:type II secretion system protein GspL [Pseudidiomarina sp.]|uniref:type II secretion system protein GspL n=1 Tax=Pseudidiomarina sp. TaxID=2081707 RepID=UPI00299D523F|nr:type II secretion system protein GspL [Pseudidiomarina sp.]MDX1706519.1 type II secretion system protein GspL [Pseudidiomarina sp.]
MEQLFIRLPSVEGGADTIEGGADTTTAPVSWLIWNPGQRELIASGELNSVVDLGQLEERARHREVIVFVPGQDVLLTQAVLPAGSQRLLPQLVPNALEDELASDISDLHFSWPAGARPGGIERPLPVAVVAHSAMQRWLEWLDKAGIDADEFYPDVFMLPVPGGHQLFAMQLGNDVIVRTGAWDGFATDASTLHEMGLEGFTELPLDDPGAQAPVLTCFGRAELNMVSAPSSAIAKDQADIEVPLSIVAKEQALSMGLTPGRSQAINLRQQQYRPVRKRRKTSVSPLPWKPAAAAAALLLAIGYTTQVIEYVKLGQQSAALEQAIEDTYRTAFPDTRRIVNVRSQLRNQMAQLSGVSPLLNSPLVMLSELEPAFKAASDVRLELLRFDQGTLRLQTRANSFASLETFRTVANSSGRVTVEQGPVSNQTNGVAGTLIVRAN